MQTLRAQAKQSNLFGRQFFSHSHNSNKKEFVCQTFVLKTPAARAEQALPRANAMIIPETSHELMFNKSDEIMQVIDLAWTTANKNG
jgi:hypothetical protein